MIARLKGCVVERLAASVVIDCGGVGYAVSVSAFTLGALGDSGATVTLRIHTQFGAQDGKITLYGFATEREQQLFDLLISVKGVSASKAMPVLSSADPVAIAEWIAGEKTAQLKACRGVGKKTAEALVFELREKCEFLVATWGASGTVVSPSASRPARRVRAPILEEVGSALLSLGWKPLEVDSAVEQLEVPQGATIESLLRDALQAMPR